MTTTITITEALAELRTLLARIDTGRANVAQHMTRPADRVDPMAASGGQRAFVESAKQSVMDLLIRFRGIRSAIQRSNVNSSLECGGVSMTVAEWLTWRRELQPIERSFLESQLTTLRGARAKIDGREVQSFRGREPHPEAGLVATAALVENIDENALVEEIETFTKIVGGLDGRLTLHNSTTTIEIPG